MWLRLLPGSGLQTTKDIVSPATALIELKCLDTYANIGNYSSRPLLVPFIPIGERDTYDHNQNEQGKSEQPFWQFDEAIGEDRFHGEQAALRLKAHMSQERYHRASELDEIVPLQAKSGTRIYVLAKPYILEPDYRLTVDLYPQPKQDGAIGEVASSDWVGMRQQTG